FRSFGVVSARPTLGSAHFRLVAAVAGLSVRAPDPVRAAAPPGTRAAPLFFGAKDLQMPCNLHCSVPCNVPCSVPCNVPCRGVPMFASNALRPDYPWRTGPRAELRPLPAPRAEADARGPLLRSLEPRLNLLSRQEPTLSIQAPV